jgi:MFS family permease
MMPTQGTAARRDRADEVVATHPGARLAPYALAFASSLCIMTLELVAARLVARHLGASLIVWTSVIGVILAGICLGNVLGGRLADRSEPRKVVGPLFAMGSALTVACLWINWLVGYIPGLDLFGWTGWTIVVVTLEFLVPSTVLGMVSPVVAKIAVEQSEHAGGAIGSVYFWGAVGSIAGTFLTGFYLSYMAPTSVIVTVVAAGLALLAASMLGGVARILALATAAVLGLAAIGPIGRAVTLRRVTIGPIGGNLLAMLGEVAAVAMAIAAARQFRKARLPEEIKPEADRDAHGKGPSLLDLAALSFVASLAFMALEMVAGRLVSRQLGSSLYSWTSVIVVLLGGLSLGNLIGGKLADVIREEKQASWLFLFASVLVLAILATENINKLFIENPLGVLLRHEEGAEIYPGVSSILRRAVTMHGYAWGMRVLIVTTAVFLLPAVALGTVSPIVAKLAVERLRRSKRTGTAIGRVYAWGMVGSILGTFLTGFALIDVLGTKGMVLALSAAMALAATMLGSVWHAAWAGVPMGLCLIAFLPVDFLRTQGLNWGIRENHGDPATTDRALAFADESNYYYIKIDNAPMQDPRDPSNKRARKRTLVLDNLIHGYYLMDRPEYIEYDYEFIYAMVTRRFAEARLRAEGLDPSKASVPPLKTMFIGGGAYMFPRHLQYKYRGTEADVAEIDPAVTEANHVALGLPRDTTIKTTFGDARQFVARARAGKKRYDIVFGDAFNDFSVPWHMTTKEFNDMLSDIMTDDGVYMINIIDLYMSDKQAEREYKAKNDDGTSLLKDSLHLMREPADEVEAVAEARKFGAFVGAWTKTARLSFPHVAIYGTASRPGVGIRETFVGVCSKKPLDLAGLGTRPDDPQFFMTDGTRFEPRPYGKADLDALDLRSRGIILTDDYAPVENLLAPVASTRGEIK